MAGEEAATLTLVDIALRRLRHQTTHESIHERTPIVSPGD